MGSVCGTVNVVICYLMFSYLGFFFSHVMCDDGMNQRFFNDEVTL